MFYHIRIDYFDKKLKVNQTLYEYDYPTEDEVIEQIIIPYLEEKRIVFSGTFLDAEDSRQLKVYETTRDIKNMVSYANQNVPDRVFFVYHNESLQKADNYAKDLTQSMLKRALQIVEGNKKLMSESSENEKRPLLFISHASADEDNVKALVELLRTI